MKRANSTRFLLAVAAINTSLLLSQSQAAVRTWSGAGADANWSNSTNWNGTAPVNADVLLFSGATRQNNTNNIFNLSVNGLSFATGGFTLNGNQMSLNGPLTNSTGVNVLAQGVNVTVQNPNWIIAPGSELRISGTFTNNTTANPLATLAAGGTVRFTSLNCLPNRFFTLTSGSVIADGCILATLDGFRLQPPAGSNAVFQITNNASVTISGGGNLRLCQTATGGSTRLDISSGILNMATTSGAGAGDIFVGEAANTTTVFNQNGGLVEFTGNGNNRIAFANAAATASGTYNLNGGVLWTKQVTQVNFGSPGGTFNFNGGTLRPTASSTTFFQAVQSANILAGGAFIDTTNLNITIAQSFSGAGPLVKSGTGTLFLSGQNTYTGTTTVGSGTLTLTTDSVLSGDVVVADGATLNITNNNGTITVPSLTLGSSSTNTLQFNLPNGNPSAPSIAVNTLTANGYAAIKVTGNNLTPGTFPLINFTGSSGLANLHLASTPPGVTASLLVSGSSVQLVVSSVGKSLQWSGAVNANWDTTTTNWMDLSTGLPAVYSQSGGFGDFVTFDDTSTPNPNVNLTQAVSPVSMSLNASGNVFTFTGPGKITGTGTVTVNGFQTVTLGTVNDYSGGTTMNAGPVHLGADQALGTGPVVVNFGTIASDGPSSRALPNVVVDNANLALTLGDSVNNGKLTLSGGLDFGGGTGRTLTINSDVVISGPMTNGAFTTKTGTGQMAIRGNITQSALVTQTQGDVIIDGAVFNNSDGWRIENTVPSTTMRFVITNGGVFNSALSNNTGNIRVGQTGGDSSANNVLDISGTVSTAPVFATISGNNGVIMGISGANDYLYLRSGGLLATRSLSGNAPANSEAHFMGGTMRAIVNDPGFITGLTNAFMEDGGLIVDSSNYSITIPQALVASGSGGLTKIGVGTLTLTGTNTYTGPTVVSGGKLIFAPAHASPGTNTINANSILAFLQSSPPATVNLSTVVAGDGTNSALEAQLSVTNAPAAVITNLILNGPVAINVAGSFGVGQFPLFGYGTISGPGALTLGNIPLGTVGNIITNTANKTIDLVVSSVAPAIWKGNASGNWDLVSTNWIVSGAPAVYSQNANVFFDDTATTFGVNLAATLTPSTMVISNDAKAYTFSGSGILSGNMTLVKTGTNTATISSANSYTGNTTIKAGEVILGNATALGSSNASVIVQNGATLDVAGNTPGLQPIFVGGSGVDGNGALVNSGPDQNNALRAVTLTSDTVIRADGVLGIRTVADSDLGFVGNGHNLVKTGAGTLNLNGGQTNAGVTVWDTDLADVDIKQGTLGFERRMTMGRASNRVTVEPGATLLFFGLNNTLLPLQVKPVTLNNASMIANGNSASEGTQFGGPITLTGGTNYFQVLTGVTLELLGPISGDGGMYETNSANGTILLDGTNTYTGATFIRSGTFALQNNASIANTSSITVNSNASFSVSALANQPWTLGANQTLVGAGTVNGTVVANGTVSPGMGIGTLTIGGDLTLNGNVMVEVDKSAAQTSDLTQVLGALSHTGAGSIIVSNLGPALTVGETFTLFNQPMSGGNTYTVTGGGVTWSNNLAVDGTISVASVLPSGPSSREPITMSHTGNSLNLTWPTAGWRLQSNTNLSGTNWMDVPNSTGTNAVNIPINTNTPDFFLRLVYP